MKTKTIEVRVRPLLRAKQKTCPHCGSVLSARETEDLELTPRQKEVLRLIAGGATARDVAGILKVSRRTAEFHRMMLMQRLGLHTTAELTLYAATRGLL
jgi:DNA-binding CsgD family transcriptional regulator